MNTPQPQMQPPLDEPSLVVEPDPTETRQEQITDLLTEKTPDPLRLRMVATAYDGDKFFSLRASAWNYAIAKPTVGFAQEILSLYDLFHRVVTLHGPGKVRGLLEAML